MSPSTEEGNFGTSRLAVIFADFVELNPSTHLQQTIYPFPFFTNPQHPQLLLTLVLFGVDLSAQFKLLVS